MQAILEELLVMENARLSITNLKKKLAVKEEDLSVFYQELHKLELMGKIFINEDNICKKFPINFFIAIVNFSPKGVPYIIHNKQRINLKVEDLDGVMPFDTVIFDDNYQVIKVIDRHNEQVVCEVKYQNKHKYLEVCNNKNKVLVRLDSSEMKKLVEGERVLIKLGETIYNGVYQGTLIKRVGHKNDFDTELKTIAYNNGFLCDYPREVLEEIETLPDEVTDLDLRGRTDKRQDLIFTIDGENTKDIDDAVELKVLPNGNYLLTVSIAHVSHYVKPNSALWRFAEANTTSLYMANFVMAMLHAKLSNGICSLNPDVDRLARSFEMEINPFGDVINFETYPSVIHSRKQMTYENVNLILEKNIIPEGYEEYVENLQLMAKLSNILTLKRNNNGAVDFGNKEVSFKVDDDGKIEKKILIEGTAQKIIENFMVTTNVCVGEYYNQMLLPFVYRNHEFPITEKIKEVYYMLKNLGYRLEKINFTDDSFLIQKIIRSLASKEEFVVLSIFILQSMQRAYYSPENKGHFGLAEDCYSQSTSPIRRFLDLVIHTLIDYYEQNPIIDEAKINNYLTQITKSATIKERAADKAEYEATLLYSIYYMQDKIGSEFYGFIANVDGEKLCIKTTDLIDGYCYIDFIKYGFIYYPEAKMYIHKKKNIKLQIGTKIKVKLMETDLTNRELHFTLLEPLDLTEDFTLKRTKET